MQYQKGEKVPVSTHFYSTDFDCHCERPACNFTLVNLTLPRALDSLWTMVGALYVSSGYRCPSHNADPSVGGKAGSQHLVGDAADVKSIIGLTPEQVSHHAELIPAFEKGGMGVASSFVHLDVRGYHARWTY